MPNPPQNKHIQQLYFPRTVCCFSYGLDPYPTPLQVAKLPVWCCEILVMHPLVPRPTFDRNLISILESWFHFSSHLWVIGQGFCYFVFCKKKLKTSSSFLPSARRASKKNSSCLSNAARCLTSGRTLSSWGPLLASRPLSGTLGGDCYDLSP